LANITAQVSLARRMAGFAPMIKISHQFSASTEWLAYQYELLKIRL
jgi:hypothetical protein